MSEHPGDRGSDGVGGAPAPPGTVRHAFLGLGSNVGDRRRHLRDAVESLSGVTAVSQVYETEPIGGPADQGPYLNCVVELSTTLSPRQLLGICHRLESAAGRVRGERWGPRTLDVDVLLVGDLRVDEPDLILPHPRMRERRFVLAPLAELAPELVSDVDLSRADGRVAMVGSITDPSPATRVRRRPSRA